MTLESILASLARKKVTLSERAGDLVVLGRREALTSLDIEILREHKEGLLSLIRQGEYARYIDGNGASTEPPNLIPPGAPRITPNMLNLIELKQEEIDRIACSVAGGAGNIQDIYPLAPLQEGILFHHLMARDGDPYLMSGIYAFETRAHLDRYIEALNVVMRRNDILRTAFAWEGMETPVQVVWRDAPLPVEEIAFPSQGNALEQLRAHIDARRYRLDIQRAPLLRGFIAAPGSGGRWILLLVLHHLVGDHISLQLMQSEICACLAGGSEQLPPALPFRNFIARTRSGAGQREHEAFFRRLLGDVDEPTTPYGLLNIQGEGLQVSAERLAVTPELAAGLRGAARRLGVSAASIFHLAWAKVLARLSGRDDVVFGTVLFGRIQGGLGAGRTLGLFMNTLPARIKLGGVTAEEGVRRIQALLAELLRHEHASLVLAQRCSAVVPPTPLFSAILNYRHNAGTDGPELLDGVEIVGAEDRTNYPLTLVVDDLGDEFELSVQIQTPFSALRVCHYMRTALESLVELLDQAPGALLADIDILPPAERKQITVDWNGTAARPEPGLCLHQMFERQVLRNPSAVAVSYQGRQLTYEALNERSNRVAHHLRTLGVGPDIFVGICMERSPETIIGLLAILKAGGAYVPFDPSYPADRLAAMFADCRPRVLLTQRQLSPNLAFAGSAVFVVDDENPALADCSAGNPVNVTAPRNLAYVIYTSGSTGRPKATLVEHSGFMNLLNWYIAELKINANDRVLLFSSLSFDLTQKNIFAPLLVGARLHVPLEGYAPDQASAMLEDQGITLINCAPSAFYPLLSFDLARRATRLRHIVLGGEPIQTALIHSAFAGQSSTIMMHNTYGPTEATDIATFYSWDPTRSIDVLPIGRPITNVQIYILDIGGAPAPIGVPGEIHIGGAGVARGYLNQPDLTEQRYIPDLFSRQEEARLYKTGDLGRWLPDGTVEFLGRRDFQVKLRGFRIELGEIECRLAEHPAVREAIVVARKTEEDDHSLAAYVTLQPAWMAERRAELEAAQISLWRETYETTYARSERQLDEADFVGWNSSYDGLPFPAVEMQEWWDNTVDRVLALNPARVLEIGCGSGLLLLRLAPHCIEYVGTDISPETLRRLRRRQEHAQIGNVELYECSADDLSRFEHRRFDTVIVNSVIQHFPDANYLKEVIEGALELLVPNGHMFIGDVRNLTLLNEFHTSVQFERAADDSTLAELQEKICTALDAEQELVIDPAFFLTLSHDNERIGSIQIMLKTAQHHNELTNFRYDVVLHRDEYPLPATLSVSDWSEEAFTLEKLRNYLIEGAPEAALIRNIANARIAKHLELCTSLGDHNSVGDLRVAPLRRRWHEFQGDSSQVDPCHLIRAAQDMGYYTELSWCGSGGAGDYTAILRKIGTPGAVTPFPHERIAVAPPATRVCANDPLQQSIRQQAVEEIESKIKRQLPAFMVPASLMCLDRLPLTGNGKIDRARLPSPERRKRSIGGDTPHTPLEVTLAAAWKKLLRLNEVGIHENFFELGGHSLSAVQLMSLLRQEKIEIQVADVFRFPTISALSACVMSRKLPISERDAMPIRSGGAARPLFLVHDGEGGTLYTVLLSSYIDIDIPIYALPAVPVDERQIVNFEGMAARHIRLMREVQPHGPYRVAGYCTGGTIAYEIASQLLGADEDVEFLGLVDSTYLAEARPAAPPFEPREFLLDMIWSMAIDRPDIRAHVDTLRARRPDMNMNGLVNACSALAIVPPTLRGLDTAAITDLLRRYYTISQADSGQYVAHPLPIAIHYFSAADDTPEQPLRGWEGIIPEERQHLIKVPGTHYTMLGAPNIAVLGNALTEGLGASASLFHRSRSGSYEPHAILCRGPSDAPPLFCIPGAGANVASFLDLVRALDGRRSVYGLQPRGLDGTLVPHSTVEAAAAAYIDTIERIQPASPVHLLGHSFGGWVAFEIAGRLLRAGREVASLTILDSAVPRGDAAVAELSHAEVVQAFVEVTEQFGRCALGISWEDIARRDAQSIFAMLHERMVTAGLLPRRAHLDTLRGPLRCFARCLRTPYCPGDSYPRLVRLLVQDDPKLDAVANREMCGHRLAGWSRWAPRLTYWRGPGDHMTILKPPHVDRLAEALNDGWSPDRGPNEFSLGPKRWLDWSFSEFGADGFARDVGSPDLPRGAGWTTGVEVAE